MNMDNIKDEIIDKISKADKFVNFKYRRKDFSFINKNESGWQKIEILFWKDSYDSSKTIIRPIYSVRFNVLHEWFENHSFKTIKDQRDNYSLGFDGKMLGGKNDYLVSVKDYNAEEVNKIYSDILNNSQLIFNNFLNLDDLYDYIVIPLIKKEKELPNVGADWIFEYATLTRIISPNDYNTVKEIIFSHVKKMNERGEPNVVKYYSRLGDIFEDLEKQKISNGFYGLPSF